MGGDHTFNGTQANCSRRQPQRGHLGRAGLGLLDHGLRRHLRAATTCSRTATRTSPSRASTSSRRPRPRPATALTRAAGGQPDRLGRAATSSRSAAPGARTSDHGHLTGVDATDTAEHRGRRHAATGHGGHGHRVRRRGPARARRASPSPGPALDRQADADAHPDHRHVHVVHRRDPQRRPADQRRHHRRSRPNHSPVVTAPADKTLPKRTPFTLTGSATDADGDVLTYLWEQTDRGGERHRPGQQHQDRTGRCSGCSAPRRRCHADGHAALPLAGGEPGRHLPSRTFPDLAADPGRQHQRGHGHLPGTAGGRHRPGDRPGAELLLGVPADQRLGGHRASRSDALPADRARRVLAPTRRADHPGGVAWDDVALDRRPDRGTVPGHLAGHGGHAGVRARDGDLERRRAPTRRRSWRRT